MPVVPVVGLDVGQAVGLAVGRERRRRPSVLDAVDVRVVVQRDLVAVAAVLALRPPCPRSRPPPRLRGGRREPATSLRATSRRDRDTAGRRCQGHGTSVTFASPAGRSGSRPFARARAEAKSWPGTTESERLEQGQRSPGRGSRRSRRGTARARRAGRRSSARPRRRRARHGFDDRRQPRVVVGDRPEREVLVERRDRAVGEIGRGQRRRRDPAGLEQLQRGLAGGREGGAAADDEHPLDVRELGGERRDAPARRPAARRRIASAVSRRPSAWRSPSAGDMGCEQPEGRHLGACRSWSPRPPARRPRGSGRRRRLRRRAASRDRSSGRA